MNDPEPDFDPSAAGGDATPVMNAFLPLTLLGVSFVIYLIAIVSNASTQRTGLNQAIERNQPVLQQAAQLKNATSKLVSDLIAVAKDGDENAKLILYRAKVAGPDGKPLVTIAPPTTGSATDATSGSSGK